MILPKMKPCSKCGAKPQWYTGWDGDPQVVAKVAVWLHCDCNFIKRSLPLAEAMDEAKAYDTVQDMANEWRTKYEP